MHEFIVTVTCVLHLNCMIPQGVHLVRQFSSAQSCEQQARIIIAQMGGVPRDYHVTCKEK